MQLELGGNSNGAQGNIPGGLLWFFVVADLDKLGLGGRASGRMFKAKIIFSPKDEQVALMLACLKLWR